MRVDAHTLPVDQVRLGDHAFACYADDDVRWETAALFAAGGRGLGYKVIVVPDPAVSRPEGYAGLGLYIDMRRVHDLGFGTGPMMRWETGAHELFAAGDLGRAGRRRPRPHAAAAGRGPRPRPDPYGGRRPALITRSRASRAAGRASRVLPTPPVPRGVTSRCC
jgi:hypothetical protein